MTEDLKDFFLLVSNSKKEKKKEINSLLEDLDIDSVFSSMEKTIKEEKNKKIKHKKEVKAFEKLD